MVHSGEEAGLAPKFQIGHTSEISKSHTDLLDLKLANSLNRTAVWWDALIWWELRRIAYNLLILLAGCGCLAAIAAQQEWCIPPNKQFVIDDVRPIVAVGFLFALAANICYTFGWTTEIFIKLVWGCPTKRFAEISFPIGLLIALLATILPSFGLIIVLTFI